MENYSKAKTAKQVSIWWQHLCFRGSQINRDQVRPKNWIVENENFFIPISYEIRDFISFLGITGLITDEYRFLKKFYFSGLWIFWVYGLVLLIFVRSVQLCTLIDPIENKNHDTFCSIEKRFPIEIIERT
jgi:hypothetical protein